MEGATTSFTRRQRSNAPQKVVGPMHQGLPMRLRLLVGVIGKDRDLAGANQPVVDGKDG